MVERWLFFRILGASTNVWNYNFLKRNHENYYLLIADLRGEKLDYELVHVMKII